MTAWLILGRVARASSLLYIIVSVFYTSSFLLRCPFVPNCSVSLTPHLPDLSSVTWTSLLNKVLHPETKGTRPSSDNTNSDGTPPLDLSENEFLSRLDAITGESMLYWASSNMSGQQIDFSGLGSWLSHQFAMSELLFLSKAFSNSMHPMKIIPFFYKASDVFDDDDITVTTLVTNNRLHVLRTLAERYDGPLSVTIHLPFSPGDSSSSLQANLATLHKLLCSSPALASRADIHLVISPFPRAFNAWRNLARLAVRTKYILLLDVDFALCTSWRGPVQTLLRGAGEMARRMREGSAALVIPAFEYVHAAEGRDQSMFPRNKPDLYDLVRAKTVAPFHTQWAPGHNSTDYERFFKAQPGEIYRVTQYQSAYEPYVIVKRDAGGWCDERFTGYGGNKAACLFEMYLSGISFYVLGDHFLIHQNHLYEEEARRSERKYNRKIYADFKEEACLRYIRRFYDEGTLNTTRGHNAQEECQKIKGIGKIVTQVLYGR